MLKLRKSDRGASPNTAETNAPPTMCGKYNRPVDGAGEAGTEGEEEGRGGEERERRGRKGGRRRRESTRNSRTRPLESTRTRERYGMETIIGPEVQISLPTPTLWIQRPTRSSCVGFKPPSCCVASPASSSWVVQRPALISAFNAFLHGPIIVSKHGSSPSSVRGLSELSELARPAR